MITVRSGPDSYICQPGILEQIDRLLNTYRFQKGLLITGEKSWEASKSYFPHKTNFEFWIEKYHGECSDSEINRLTNKAEEFKSHVVIGVGGGKVLDLAKSVANRSGLPAILIPTLASTCAAWTPLSVIYNDEGQYIRFDVFPKGTLLVLVEPEILLNAPLSTLRAGIGDTLAKWYEAEALTRTLTNKPMAVQMAIKSAELCKDVLLKDGFEAIQAAQRKTLNPAFLRVVESIVMIGGMVGGFGDKYGRIAGAHSVHNALTHIYETHHLLHGEKVAYGILVQLALEKKFTEINRLVDFYKLIHLPYCLKDLGIHPGDQNCIQLIAQYTLAKGESIHYMDESYNESDLIEAINELEEIIFQHAKR
ncbi:iron-containing alcohol dehydrogenase family protein [Collibacillus ludicampi]|nr:iron-containing alcohol dehydrogenase family protein [Collibacillus ludicampi]